ncbi:MAG: PHP domain-containing protein [Traorella sp.]
MIDGHVHLEKGPLTIEYVQEFVDEAQKKGITTLQILDHTHRFKEFEFMYEDLKEISIQKDWLSNKFNDSLDDYIKLIEKCKLASFPIEIKFGLEVCYVKKYESMLKEVLSHYSFDFLVGAVHSIDSLLYDMPFSKDILWDVYPIDEIYDHYYQSIQDCIQSHLFTQLAHPDTIKMANQYPSYNLNNTYDTIAFLLSKYNMNCENNTGVHYRYHHQDIGLSQDFLEALKKHHVKLITASDAHYPYDVGKCFTAIR